MADPNRSTLLDLVSEFMSRVDPNCPRCHGTGVVGGHWMGDRWCGHEHTWQFCPCSEEAALGVGKTAEGSE